MNSLPNSDLAVAGFDRGEIASRQTWCAGAGFISAVAILVAITSLDLTVQPFVGVLIVAGVTAYGFSIPVQSVKKTALRRRQEFSSGFSTFLDLVNVLLAGGAGVETALVAAAGVGNNWVFKDLRRVLKTSRDTRQSPWIVLANFGNQFGFDDVVEVAGSLQLAGEQGSRIRKSLMAKATTIRARQTAQAEALAHAATEKMGIPTVMLFVGFVLLLGYPAMNSILGSW